jgi:hypothetical protein
MISSIELLLKMEGRQESHPKSKFNFVGISMDSKGVGLKAYKH